MEAGGGRRYSRARLLVIAVTATLLAVIASVVPSDALARPLVARTLAYCERDGLPLLMDTYVPADGGLHAAVLRVHGGGWVSGTRIYGLYPEAVTQLLVQRGVFVASIDYRLAPAHRWPAQRDDVSCAIDFLRAHAAALAIDPNRIGAIGESAGGQLVSLAALTGGRAARQPGAPARAFRAVVDLWGPTDLTTGTWDPYMLGVGRATFGARLGSPARILAAASPAGAVAAGAPPFLIVQGLDDEVVPASQSTELAGRLRQAGCSVQLTLVDHAGHGLAPAGGVPSLTIDQIAAQATDFLVANLS